MVPNTAEAAPAISEISSEFALRDRTRACKLLFQNCFRIPELNKDDWLELRCAEFNWWTSGLNADKRGPGSLDSRLKLREDVRDVVADLLEGLLTALEECDEIASSQLLQEEQVQGASAPDGQLPSQDEGERSPSPWSDMTDSSDGHSESSMSEKEDTDQRPYKKQRFYIETNLEILLHIHGAIKRSGVKFRNQQADDKLRQTKDKYQLHKAVVGEYRALYEGDSEIGKHERFRLFLTRLVLGNGYTENLIQRMARNIQRSTMAHGEEHPDVLLLKKLKVVFRAYFESAGRNPESLIRHVDRNIQASIYTNGGKHPDVLLQKKLKAVFRAYYYDSARLNPIQHRLINANVVRRNRLDYAGGIQKTRPGTQKDQLEPEPIVKEAVRRSIATEQVRQVQAGPLPSPQTPSISKSKQGKTQSRESFLSKPATALDPTFSISGALSPPKTTKSAATKMSARVALLDYPKCPTKKGPCPFCLSFLDNEYTIKNRWRAHVAQDLCAYVCVFEDCQTPDDMYTSTYEWMSHMAKFHSVTEWVCMKCTAAFTELEQVESKIAFLEKTIRKAARPVEKTNDNLHMELNNLMSRKDDIISGIKNFSIISFTDAMHLKEHVLSSHPEIEHSELSLLIDAGKRSAGIKQVRCPLCRPGLVTCAGDESEDEVTVHHGNSGQDVGLLQLEEDEHIATHIHEFSLHSFPWHDDTTSGKSLSHSIPSSRQEIILQPSNRFLSSSSEQRELYDLVYIREILDELTVTCQQLNQLGNGRFPDHLEGGVILKNLDRIKNLFQSATQELDQDAFLLVLNESRVATSQLYTATADSGSPHSEIVEAYDELIVYQEQLKVLLDAAQATEGIETFVPRTISTGLGYRDKLSDQRHQIGVGSGTINVNHGVNLHDDTWSEILQALNTSPYAWRKDRNPDRVIGTCEWFISHSDFHHWLDSTSSSMLLVSANPGCGKSVLAKYLVNELKTTELRTTCYFFFKDDFEDQKSARSALSCILHQLFMQRQTLFSDRIIRQFRSYKAHLANSYYELWELWDILITVAQDKNAGEIICILDALDECKEQERQDLAKLIREFYGPNSDTKKSVNLKFLITSRPYDKIRRDLIEPLNIQEFPVIHLKGDSDAEVEKIAGEIILYIQERVSRIRTNLGLTKKEEEILFQGLSATQNKTYLWVYLTLNWIETEISNKINETEIRNIISTLPRTVEEAYEVILSKSINTEETQKLLHIIVAAERPLTLPEVDLALAIRQNYTSYKDLDPRPPTYRVRGYIKDLCGDFINITDDKIYLLHPTAKQFLVPVRQAGSFQANRNHRLTWKYSLAPQESHRILCNICIWHLLFTEFETHPLTGQGKITDYMRNNLFLEYSAKNWATHFRSSDIEENEMMESLQRICDVTSNRCLTWFKIYWEGKETNFPLGFTTLMIASYFGLESIVKLQLKLPDVEIDSVDSTYQRSALSWASENGFEGVVKLLIKGPRIRLQNVLNLSFLRGANVNAKDKDGRTPLFYATCNGHLAIVQRLVQAGARADLEDNIGETPIAYALRTEQQIIVNELIKGTK